MSVKDSALHPVTGNILDPTPTPKPENPAMQADPGDCEKVIRGFLNEADSQPSGLSSVLNRMRVNGLGSTLDCWAAGEAQEISPDDVGQALGQQFLSGVASRAGVSVRVAADELSAVLPQIIQQVAPGGQPKAPQISGLASQVAAAVL